VYCTGFDEPLGEAIYHYDNSGTSPYITDAVLSDGTLYAFNKYKPSKVYRIEGGAAVEAADTGDRTVCCLDSYCPEGSSKASLVICLTDGLMVYEDGTLTAKDTLLKIDDHPLVLILYIAGFLEYVLIGGIIINLIIRRKTLFYKQLMATVPVFAVIAIVFGTSIYDSSTKNITKDIETELNIIVDLTAGQFDGYDFSGVFEADSGTGEAYSRLHDKLDEIDFGHTVWWSRHYKFSIVYRIDDTHAAVLVRDTDQCMPMFTEEKIFSPADVKDYEGVYYVEAINNLLASNRSQSDISAYRVLNDKDGTGRIYIKVTTANKRVWEEMAFMWLEIIFYVAVIIIIFTITNLLISLYIRRMIRKATGVVRRISEGDLSARIEYKSKDEMGEICNEVNTMGQSLERLFDEKDKTEKFYYKFVPEQFRTLLGKEEFTDLKLGDSDNRELTVLFLDIRAFSLLSEKMTTKENFEFVNIIYGIAGPIIRAHNGFIDKYIGDAIMALFENADDAVKSGIDIYRAIVLDPETSKRLGVDQIGIGIGIHSGMAQIGIVGEEERLSGTVISDTVNLASRLESLTKQYKTAMLVSDDTLGRMTDPSSLDLRFLGDVQVAGVIEVEPISEVLDCLPDSERQKRHDNSEILSKAISLFSEGDLPSAIKLLQDLEDSGKGDHVTAMYLKYISELEPDSRPGVFRFVRK